MPRSVINGPPSDLVLGIVRRSLEENWNRYRAAHELNEDPNHKAARLLGIEAAARQILKAVC